MGGSSLGVLTASRLSRNTAAIGFDMRLTALGRENLKEGQAGVYLGGCLMLHITKGKGDRGMKSRMVGLAVAALVLAMVGTSQAVLIDRGGGLIYDTVLNITWLQDASLASSENLWNKRH